jgi:hypothetical protein
MASTPIEQQSGTSTSQQQGQQAPVAQQQGETPKGQQQQGQTLFRDWAVERQPPCPRATTILAGFQAAEVGVLFGFSG